MKKMLVALLILLCPLAKAEVTENDAKEVSSVIMQMFAAMHDSDYKTAFALQTEENHLMFKDAEDFGKTLSECCTALRDTVRANVIGANEVGKQLSVVVLMLDKFGNRWAAQFVMEKHERWQIDAIHIQMVNQSGKKEMKT